MSRFSAIGRVLAASIVASGIWSFVGVSAEAAPIDVRFGFTSFTSSIERGNSPPAHVFVNGTEVFPVGNDPFTVPLTLRASGRVLEYQPY